MPQPPALLVGCGLLGRILARSLVRNGPLHIITRSYQRKEQIQDIFHDSPYPQSHQHFVRDIGNSRFSFNLKPYQSILFCPAVSIDKRLHSATEKIHFKGTRNFINQCIKHRFEGRILMVGCVQGLMELELPKGFDTISESMLPSFGEITGHPLWQQYQQFLRYRQRTGIQHAFVFCGQLYQADSYPEPKSLNGLTVTTRDPHSWMNLIHVEDAARIIHLIFQKEKKGDFILTDGRPIRRIEYYKKLTKHYGKKAIKFIPDENRREPSNRVASQRMGELSVNLKYPQFML